jgi:hypothetical protein
MFKIFTSIINNQRVFPWIVWNHYFYFYYIYNGYLFFPMISDQCVFPSVNCSKSFFFFNFKLSLCIYSFNNCFKLFSSFYQSVCIVSPWIVLNHVFPIFDNQRIFVPLRIFFFLSIFIHQCILPLNCFKSTHNVTSRYITVVLHKDLAHLDNILNL